MTKQFWKAAGVRMVKDVSWGVVLSTAALSALASLLTSIVAGLPEVN